MSKSHSTQFSDATFAGTGWLIIGNKGYFNQHTSEWTHHDVAGCVIHQKAIAACLAGTLRNLDGEGGSSIHLCKVPLWYASTVLAYIAAPNKRGRLVTTCPSEAQVFLDPQIAQLASSLYLEDKDQVDQGI